MVKVLFVDDEPFILNMYQRVLRNTEFQCIPLADSRTVFQHDLANIDIAAVDHQMPHISGIEILQELQQKHPTVRRLLISGNLTRAELELPSWVSLDAALEKPVTKACLLACLQRLAKPRGNKHE